MELSEIAKISGHADINVLFKTYVNHGQKTIDKARDMLNEMNADKGVKLKLVG